MGAALGKKPEGGAPPTEITNSNPEEKKPEKNAAEISQSPAPAAAAIAANPQIGGKYKRKSKRKRNKRGKNKKSKKV